MQSKTRSMRKRRARRRGPPAVAAQSQRQGRARTRGKQRKSYRDPSLSTSEEDEQVEAEESEYALSSSIDDESVTEDSLNSSDESVRSVPRKKKKAKQRRKARQRRETKVVHSESSEEEDLVQDEEVEYVPQSSEEESVSDSSSAVSLPAKRRRLRKSSSGEEGEASDELPEREFEYNAESESEDSKEEESSHECNSEDSVTLEPIPKDTKHLWWSAGAKATDVYCYSYATLLRIKRTSKENKWMEPPIFRVQASPKTLDDMKKVFGVERVENQKAKRKIADEEWIELMENYRRRCLPRDKLYTCPVCFEAMKKEHLRLRGNPTNPRRKNLDPLVVLYMDEYFSYSHTDRVQTERVGQPIGTRDAAQKAASICFKYKADVLRHLIHEHNIHNGLKRKYADLFKMYNLRETDGLIQHYYSHRYKRPNWSQYYWQTAKRVEFFIQIWLVLIKKEPFEINPHEVPDEDAKAIWKELTDRYRDNTEAESDDMEFVASNDDENEDGVLDHVKLDNDEVSDDENERALMRYYKNKEKMMTKRKRKNSKEEEPSSGEDEVHSVSDNSSLGAEEVEDEERSDAESRISDFIDRSDEESDMSDFIVQSDAESGASDIIEKSDAGSDTSEVIVVSSPKQNRRSKVIDSDSDDDVAKPSPKQLAKQQGRSRLIKCRSEPDSSDDSDY